MGRRDTSAIILLTVLLSGTSVHAADWTSIRPAVTTEAELVAAFGSPDEVVATYPWAEWSARWKKRPLTNSYMLRYRAQGSQSVLLVGPGGKADDVEVAISNGKVGSVRWAYGGPSARAAAATLRADADLSPATAESVSHSGKNVTGGWLWVELGPGDNRVQVLLQLK